MKRIRVEEEKPKTTATRLKGPVGAFIYIKVKSGIHPLKELRKYFVGRIRFATVHVYYDGYGPALNKKTGQYILTTMFDGRQNGGVPFETEKQLHAFLAEALEDSP